MMFLKAQAQLSSKDLSQDQCSYTVLLDDSIKVPTQDRNVEWRP